MWRRALVPLLSRRARGAFGALGPTTAAAVVPSRPGLIELIKSSWWQRWRVGQIEGKVPFRTAYDLIVPAPSMLKIWMSDGNHESWFSDNWVHFISGWTSTFDGALKVEYAAACCNHVVSQLRQPRGWRGSCPTWDWRRAMDQHGTWTMGLNMGYAATPFHPLVNHNIIIIFPVPMAISIWWKATFQLQTHPRPWKTIPEMPGNPRDPLNVYRLL